MKIVKCLSNGSYKLTEGDLYEIVAEKDGYYHLINDNDKLVKYNTGFFEDHELEEEVVIKKQIVEEVERNRTIEEIIDSIGIEREYDEDDEIYFTNIYYLDEFNRKIIINNEFNTGMATECSCGIGDIIGLDDMCNNISKTTDDVSLRKALFIKCIKNYVIDKDSRAAFILSTAIDNISNEYMDALDELSDHFSEKMYNPNSGNYIKLWIFYA